MAFVDRLRCENTLAVLHSCILRPVRGSSRTCVLACTSLGIIFHLSSAFPFVDCPLLHIDVCCRFSGPQTHTSDTFLPDNPSLEAEALRNTPLPADVTLWCIMLQPDVGSSTSTSLAMLLKLLCPSALRRCGRCIWLALAPGDNIVREHHRCACA